MKRPKTIIYTALNRKTNEKTAPFKGAVNIRALLAFVENSEVFLVCFIKVFKDLVVSVINRLVSKVGLKALCGGDKLLCVGYVTDKTDAYGDNDCRADCADILRRVNGFNCFARDVGKHLTGDVGKRAAADKANRIGGLDFLVLSFKEPAKMEANALADGSDKL